VKRRTCGAVSRCGESDPCTSPTATSSTPDRRELDEGLRRLAGQEAVRRERIDDVIESTQLRGIYEVLDEFDFSTDETVARGRPAR
jgi:hypothetical protein